MTDPSLRSTAEPGRFYPVANVRFEHGGPHVYGRLRDQRAISGRSLGGGWLTLLQPGGKVERVMGIEPARADLICTLNQSVAIARGSGGDWRAIQREDPSRSALTIGIPAGKSTVGP